MCINPRKLINKGTGEEITVSCGKCILCRRKKCREWAIKLYNESQYHTKMCMITLTFRPKFLFRPREKELKKYKTKTLPTGEKIRKEIKYKTIIGPHYITNVKKTGWLVTLFIKKLRKEMDKYNIKFSYYAVGEHGSQNTHRAHWHIIFFGINNETLGGILQGASKKGKEIYWSEIIHKLWNYDKMNIGMHTISDVNSKTIKYVANYTMKKMYKNIENEEKFPTIMRFSNQSKIGLKWARRYHNELRKGYLIDADNIKYGIPKSYYHEMTRYFGEKYNNGMQETAEIIESLKDENFKRLSKLGLFKIEELRKKAKKLEYKYSKEERDIF